MNTGNLTTAVRPIDTPSPVNAPWIPDLSDGTYRNPIIHADYSDPDVIRQGHDFFLTASSFNCTPGLPILHSPDLVNWTIINHAVKNLPHPRYGRVRPGCGIWAPSLRFHAGKFWIFFPMPDEGIYVTTANHPAEKWSEPHLLQEGKGLIDPCPLWDDDGKAYLVHAYARSRSGIKHLLRIRPMSPDGSRLLGEGDIIFNDPDRHPTLEGPKFLKKDGWYYISAPAGGVENGWQVVLRSKNIYGPYEDKIVLAQGRTSINGPHQGALVDTPNGEWWFIHFQDAGVYGRIVHLQPVLWRDGWPLIGQDNGNGCGEPVLHFSKPLMSRRPLITVPQTSDEFDSPNLGLQWQWNANHQDDWYSLQARKGWLRLFPQLASSENLTQLPNLLLQKFPAPAFTVETLLEFSPIQQGEEAGLVVLGDSHIALGLQHNGTKNRVVLRTDGEWKSLTETDSNVVKLRLKIQSGGEYSLSFAANGNFVHLPQTFQARKGVWIGSKLGLYSQKQVEIASARHIDIDYFRFG